MALGDVLHWEYVANDISGTSSVLSYKQGVKSASDADVEVGLRLLQGHDVRPRALRASACCSLFAGPGWFFVVRGQQAAAPLHG